MSQCNELTNERNLTNYSIKMLLSSQYDDKKQQYMIDNVPILGEICILGEVDSINKKNNHIEIVLFDLTAKIKCLLWNKYDTMQHNEKLKFSNILFQCNK